MALALQQNVFKTNATLFCNSFINVIRFYYGNSEIISLDRYCTDRGMELVPALDVEGDCKEPRVLQELVVTSQACFPSTK